MAKAGKAKTKLVGGKRINVATGNEQSSGSSSSSPTYTAGNTRTDKYGNVTALPDRVATADGSERFGADEAEQDAIAAGPTPANVQNPVQKPPEAPTSPVAASTDPSGVMGPEAPVAVPAATPTPTQNRYQTGLAAATASGV